MQTDLQPPWITNRTHFAMNVLFCDCDMLLRVWFKFLKYTYKLNKSQHIHKIYDLWRAWNNA